MIQHHILHPTSGAHEATAPSRQPRNSAPKLNSPTSNPSHRHPSAHPTVSSTPTLPIHQHTSSPALCSKEFNGGQSGAKETDERSEYGRSRSHEVRLQLRVLLVVDMILDKQERRGLEVAKSVHGTDFRFANAPSGLAVSRRSALKLLRRSGGRGVNSISTPRKGGKTMGFML